jgi:SAM-dependent methyltransferase
LVDLEKYGRSYAEQYEHAQFETVLVEVRRKAVLQSLAKYSHRRILEVGCGLEPLFPHLASFDRYWIVEPVAEFAENARVVAGADSRVQVVHGFLESAGNELADTFDFIVVSSLLHEVKSPVALLASIGERCGPDTIVHINVPNVNSFHRLLAVESGLITDIFEKSATEERFQRQTRFDRAGLVTMVEQNGFRILDSATYFVKPFSHAQMEQMLRHSIIELPVIRGLEAMTKYMPDLGCEMYVEARLA